MKHKRCRGLSLIELLLGLALGTLLLTAVAAAMQASAMSYRVNEQFFSATQTARVAMLNMTTQLRRCKTAFVGEESSATLLPDGTKTTTASTMTLTLMKADGVTPYILRYTWSNQKLYIAMDPTSDTTLGTVAASNVASLTLNAHWIPITTIDPTTNQQVVNYFVDNVQLKMLTTVGQESLLLTDSVVPRCMMQKP